MNEWTFYLEGAMAGLVDPGPQVGWRAWYANGQVFTSLDTAPRDLPKDGLVIVMEYYTPPYANVFHGEFLAFRDGRWFCHMTRQQARAGGGIDFSGTLMADTAWLELQDRAMRTSWQ